MTSPKPRAERPARGASAKAKRSPPPKARRAPTRLESPAERRLAQRCDALRAEVAELRGELEAQGRDRAELCSALSHDLRNPLTVVVWSAQLLARRILPEDAARRHLDGVTRAAEELNQMLYELSDTARIPDGRIVQALELREAEVGALVEHAAAGNRAQAQTKDIALTTSVAAEVGAICCDKDRVGRVLGTLISGAVRRSPRGGAVSVRASRDGRGGQPLVRIVVQDAGPDIAPEDRDTLFELPTAPRAGAPRRPRPGPSAIALFVARGVIEAHGGRLWLESEPGRGARFVAELPVRQDQPVVNNGG